jgi:hypothetical protein
VDLRNGSYQGYSTGGGSDTVVSNGGNLNIEGIDPTSLSTFTFNGSSNSTVVTLDSSFNGGDDTKNTVTETRFYSASGAWDASGVKYAGFTGLRGYGNATFNFTGTPTSEGSGNATAANPAFLSSASGATITLNFGSLTSDIGVTYNITDDSGVAGHQTLKVATLGATTTTDISWIGKFTNGNGGRFRIMGADVVNGTSSYYMFTDNIFGKVTINAGNGNDSLYSADARRLTETTPVRYDDFPGDVLNGQGGNDIFYRVVDAVRTSAVSSNYRDTLNGGAGIDTLVLSAVTVGSGPAINQSAVLGSTAPVRAFFDSTATAFSGGNLASVAKSPGNTAGATLSSIENVVIGGAGFVADSGDGNDGTNAVGNQYWFTAGQTATKNTPAAMLFNGSSADLADTVTTYTGNVLVYFDGLGTANINQTGGTYSIGSAIDNQPININPSTGVSETLGSGQVSLFALGDVGNASLVPGGVSVRVDLTNSTIDGTLRYYNAANTGAVGGVNKIWRPVGGQDDDIYAIYTTKNGDTITGDAFGNIIFTGGGKDTVDTKDGNDTVYAAGGEATTINLGNNLNGSDVLEAAFYKTNVTGNTSTIDGGSGIDELRFGLTNTGWSQPGGGRQILGVGWHTDGVDLDLTTGKATGTSLLGTGNTINFSNFEKFHLTNGADTVTVNDTVMGGLTGSNLIDASPLRLGGIYESATTSTGYSPAGYNGANSNEKFYASNNTSIVDTIKYTGSNNSIAASDFFTKGFRSFEKFDLTGSTATSFAVNVDDIINLTESRTLAIDKTASINVNIAYQGWAYTVDTSGGSQVYTFTKDNQQNVVLAITG